MSLVVAQTAVAQKQATGLMNPVAITSHLKTGHVFLVEEGEDRLVRWDGEKVDPLYDSLSTSDIKLSQIAGVTFRGGNRLSLIGYADDKRETARIATLKVDLDNPAEFDEAMSADLLIKDKIVFGTIASTDLAIYFATSEQDDPEQYDSKEEKHKLWQLPTGKATLGKPRAMQTLDGKAESLTVTPQGHVVAAVHGESKSTLQFFHASNGQRLLVVPTELESISSLEYSQESKLLYATGSKSDQSGVYRLEVFFDGSKQTARSAEVAVIENAKGLTISAQQNVVMIGGEEDGRILTIDLK